MIDQVYNARILELAGNAPAAPRLAAPDGTARAHSKLCGSTIEVDVSLDDDVIVAYGHDVKACALGQASAAIVARHAVGSSAEEISGLRKAMSEMLKHGGPPPDGKFSELIWLEPVRDYPTRHASTLLVFDALVKALDKASDQRGDT